MNIIIRPLEPGDAEAVADLSRQLGYPISIEDTYANLEKISGLAEHAMFAAMDGIFVKGWIHVRINHLVESGTFAEITGLVVDESYRNKGLGKMLIQTAMQWCHEMMVEKLRVRTNVKRLDTHRFYEHLGFREIKQQKVYEIMMHDTEKLL